jgi:serine/threonine protein kinase
VKLADFGLSKRLTNTTGYNTQASTWLYMALEILDFLNLYKLGSDYTDAVDIWFTRCIVYYLITRVVSFPLSTLLIKYCKDKSLFPYNALFNSSIKGKGLRFL